MKNNDSDNNTPVENIHDKFFWDVYGRPENAAGFLKDFLPSNILKNLNLDHIEVNKKSFLSEEYKAHYSDIVIETRFRDVSDRKGTADKDNKGTADKDRKDAPDQRVFIYFLLEHKSYIPARAPFQLLRYMVEQWYELEKKGLLGDRLPPVIPVLIYQGNKTWTPSVSFHDFINIPVEEMKAYLPGFHYFLNDTSRADEEQFKSSVIIRCWHIIVKYLNEPVLRDKITDIVKMMFELMNHDTALEYLDILMKYLANTDNKITREDAVNAIETVLPQRGAEMIRGWAQEFVEEGIQKGLQEGLQIGEQKGRQEGRQEGMQKGELIGKIQLIQQILKQTVSTRDELLEKTIPELQSMLDNLEKKMAACSKLNLQLI